MRLFRNCFALSAFFLITQYALGGHGLPSCKDVSPEPQHVFDFIVVGAGPGGGPLAGRLAESGYSVLVVDAGQNVETLDVTIPAYFNFVLSDPVVALNYTIHEYPPDFEFQSNNTWYPRAQAVGGCAIHNALTNCVAGLKPNFDLLETTFDDPSWKLDNMWDYFVRIERNSYLPEPNPDHGFHGWLGTIGGPVTPSNGSDSQLNDITIGLANSAPNVLDINTRASPPNFTMTSLSNTVNSTNERSSVKERLHQAPQAYGLQVAPNASLPVSDQFTRKVELNFTHYYARHEVIVSAGLFQSPQLLSGIGNKTNLESFGIEPIVDLPGVGQNLRDNDEIPTTWLLKQNPPAGNCTFGTDPATDPCLAAWDAAAPKHDGTPYTPAVGFPEALVWQSVDGLDDPDVLQYWVPAWDMGYVSDPGFFINGFSAITLKGHASSRGYVRLTGSHPQDVLDIQKLHFQPVDSPDIQRDLAALRGGIRTARQVVQLPHIAEHILQEVNPGSDVQTDEELNEYIFEHIFAHHGCCTNKMGADDDNEAVLDGRFRVRSVSSLRVVDMSSWPDAPGFFPTTPTYMLSEKAADLILEDTQRYY
ncbi:hypothetical protein B0H17DRAFT_1106607 [Mycena rosella]|uniref:Glucose-methanol-choline oxidoreductase N-terminal domain-containing protein n=1 Tax=Mycena rosella TaxID=1033263 RepID=A0AAD7FTT3_MYCRO|nr:hypothetical protein B0H17DRAFT_1106607 [Mycena rosella]